MTLQGESHIDNKRIAKNTLLLYIRTLFVMIISLYTSRVVLRVLGVDNYGIYQVVGGLVAMFSILSTSLSTAISRYITYEIGNGNIARLRKIFSTSILIQIFIAVVVVIAAEFLATWYIDKKMTVPPDRLSATRYVLQFSLAAFCINLLSIPYNACIIAHERMKAFAYVSVLDSVLKLGICYMLLISPVDRLTAYAALLMVESFIIRIVYSWYCHRNFEECKGKIVFDRKALKEMLSFSGWSFFTNSAVIFNNQGLTMLINVYFGLTVNAARGLATQVENAVLQFVNNFTMAVNPQITKSYASGEIEAMHKLICRGAKFSYFAMLIMAMPLIFEMRTVLNLWLGDVPEYTVIFSQLSLVMGMCDCIGTTAYTACMATGRLRKYALIVTPIACVEFVFSWVLFYLGADAVSSYYLYILVKMASVTAKAFIMQSMIGLPVIMYVKDVFFPILKVTTVAIIPTVLVNLLDQTYFRVAATITVSVLSVSFATLYTGMDNTERQMIISKILSKFHR